MNPVKFTLPGGLFVSKRATLYSLNRD